MGSATGEGYFATPGWLRAYDVRTGKLVDRATTLTGTGKIANNEIETTNGLQTFHMLLPIPQNEIDLNKDAELTQNLGYIE